MNDQVTQDEGDLNKEFPDVEPEAAKALQDGSLDERTDDEKEYSKKVLKRIGKEVSRRKSAETERDLYRGQMDSANTKMAEMKRIQVEAEKKRLNAEVEDFSGQAEKAFEAGETKDYMTANDKLLNAKVALSHIPDEPEKPATQPPNYAPEAQKWLDDNPEIINNEETYEQAKHISEELQNAGYGANDPEHYRLLNERLAKPPIPPAENSHVPGNDPPPQTRGGRLTTDDLRTMSKFGFDPNSAADRKNWQDSNRVAQP